MAITNIQSVAAMFPTFQRGESTQKPSDAFIQQLADDIAGRIVAVLQRRFGEAISRSANLMAWLQSIGIPTRNWAMNSAYLVGDIVADNNVPPGVQQCTTAGTSGASIPSWNPTQGGTTTDGSVTWTNIGQSIQFQVLEQGNRYGAASQLGKVLAQFQIVGTERLAEHYDEADWKPFMSELNAVDDKGKPKAFGQFDVLFDPNANVSSPRPGMLAIAGGDQPINQGPAEENLGAFFGKWGVDGGRNTQGMGGNPLSQED